MITLVIAANLKDAATAEVQGTTVTPRSVNRVRGLEVGVIYITPAAHALAPVTRHALARVIAPAVATQSPARQERLFRQLDRFVTGSTGSRRHTRR